MWPHIPITISSGVGFPRKSSRSSFLWWSTEAFTTCKLRSMRKAATDSVARSHGAHFRHGCLLGRSEIQAGNSLWVYATLVGGVASRLHSFYRKRDRFLHNDCLVCFLIAPLSRRATQLCSPMRRRRRDHDYSTVGSLYERLKERPCFGGMCVPIARSQRLTEVDEIPSRFELRHGMSTPCVDRTD